jgi:hypothetical protein
MKYTSALKEKDLLMVLGLSSKFADTTVCSFPSKNWTDIEDLSWFKEMTMDEQTYKINIYFLPYC